ncbi:hypothetical protein [Paraburkholderia unamae]|uniref:Uncharacterized protein n=1 Tax=Paraburkholderia unamae TaxID=219649 RepID=A0ACC6RXU1_9BURK
MTRLMVAQGEIGVIHPVKSPGITELATFGASPCIILGIQKGSTALMAHIHRANHIEYAFGQIDRILANNIAPAFAFIATETYDGPVQGELAQQARMISEIEERLMARRIAVVRKALDRSIAVINAQGFFLYKPGTGEGITLNEALEAATWGDAYDAVFQGLTGVLLMAIRIKKSTEAPAQAMSRMYGDGRGRQPHL